MFAKGRSSDNRGDGPASFFNLSLPDGKGTELMGELREANPGFRTLVLTGNMERTDFVLAVEAGAAGVLHKTANSCWLTDLCIKKRTSGNELA